ncbi:phosphopantetheine-binding protein [Timonella sp. A28]|uniref:phosphopantetheine-binding protein n=1 Tax=Timonella sp. A28 TaxID=3442640 RepID=UPI003EB7B839
MTNPASLRPINADDVLRDIAQTARMEPQDVDVSYTFFDLGIDSVRLMGLVEKWRSEGAQCDFSALLKNPTIRETITLVSE